MLLIVPATVTTTTTASAALGSGLQQAVQAALDVAGVVPVPFVKDVLTLALHVYEARENVRQCKEEAEALAEWRGARKPRKSSSQGAPPPPADTPQGLAACFAAFYPGSPAKAKFQQFVLDNTLCPRHVPAVALGRRARPLQVVAHQAERQLSGCRVWKMVPCPTGLSPAPAP